MQVIACHLKVGSDIKESRNNSDFPLSNEQGISPDDSDPAEGALCNQTKETTDVANSIPSSDARDLLEKLVVKAIW